MKIGNLLKSTAIALAALTAAALPASAQEQKEPKLSKLAQELS